MQRYIITKPHPIIHSISYHSWTCKVIKLTACCPSFFIFKQHTHTDNSFVIFFSKYDYIAKYTLLNYLLFQYPN